MSKLTISQRTKGKAVDALPKLYKAEPDFARELEELRVIYLPVLEQLLKVGVAKWIQMKETLTQEEFSATRDYFFGANHMISDSLADKLRLLLLIPSPQIADKLEEYEKALVELAERWQLKASWVPYVLIFDHVLDMTINNMPEEFRKAEMPIEMLEPFLPSEPLPSLMFKVNPYELMFSGRQEIQDKFARTLFDYEDKLKSLGWRELPSALERHAYWWFEHYVHHKTYPELEQKETKIYRESIKRAVWKFTKLLGIKIK